MLRRYAGQGLAEYALLIMLLAIVVVVILGLTGSAIGNMYSVIKNDIITTLGG